MSTQLLNWLNESDYPAASQPPEQYTSDEPISFVAPLTDYSIIRVSGLDAEKFMQGQFSCDLREVTDQQSRMGTANTAKGRAYAVFRIAKQDDDYLIRLPSIIADDFCQRLNKYIVFSKATLSLENNISVIGFSGQSPLLHNLIDKTITLPTGVDSSCEENGNIIIKVPSTANERYEIWCQFEMAKSLLQPQKNTPASVHYSTQSVWDWEDVNAGIADIYPETQESYVPQMLNLQHLNAISFKKGCYTGQEIVARMKYLGKLKKEMFLLSATGSGSITAGTDIFEKESGKKAGSIVRAIAPESNIRGNVSDSLLLAVLDVQTATSNIPLILQDDPSRQFQYLSLPYQNDPNG